MANRKGQHCTKIVTRQDIYREINGQTPNLSSSFELIYCSHIRRFLLSTLLMVRQNIPDGRRVYFICDLNHPIMTENIETPAGTTSANCTALLLRQNVKSQCTLKKRMVSRLWSENLVSPGADNLVQRLTERIMNPRVGGGPQAMKVHRTNCLSLTDYEVSPRRVSSFTGLFVTRLSLLICPLPSSA